MSVKDMKPLDRLIYFINEREKVRVRKELGIAKPWTDDPVIQQFRFCNVVRMDDKVSQWLLKNWHKPYKNHPNMLIACVLARHFNLPSTLKTIGFPEEWKPKQVKKIVRAIQARGETAYNGAYMIRGIETVDKVEMIVDKVAQPLYDDPPELDTSSMRACIEALLPYWGMGSFISGQIVADLRWALTGKWGDRYTYAPIGPGSKKGVNYFYGRPAKQALSQEQFLSELKDIKSQASPRITESLQRRMEMMDWQNCMCEFRAYHQAVEGIKRPKRRYNGV